jgi:hypothetical protein
VHYVFGMSLPPGPAAVASRPPRRTWDVVLTIVLLVLSVLLALLLLVISPFLAFASDSCGSGPAECNLDQMTAGFLVAAVTPAIVSILGIAVAIVLLVLRRLAFWVPLATMLLALCLFAVGVALVFGSVPGATL